MSKPSGLVTWGFSISVGVLCAVFFGKYFPGYEKTPTGVVGVFVF